MRVDDLAFWATVALVAITAVIAFKYLATTRLGSAIPGYDELAAFI